MRKFIFNGAVLSAVIGLATTIRSTRQGPRDWRVPLMWATAVISVVVAVGTVIEESRELDTHH